MMVFIMHNAHKQNLLNPSTLQGFPLNSIEKKWRDSLWTCVKVFEFLELQNNLCHSA